MSDDTRNPIETDAHGESPALPQIAGYALHSVLGRGGMATVYRATQSALDRPVAIKVVTAEADEAGGRYLERLENEARGLAALSHPNIVELHDFGRTAEGAMYYVMPLLPGGDLSGWKRPVAEAEVVGLLGPILDALAHAHAEDIVHRDLKPENILFDRHGHPKLADFGAALVRRRSRLTGEGTAIGSVGYMSPEQARGVEVDARSDLYSLAVLAFELLTDRRPYEGADNLTIALAQAEGAVPPLPRALAHWQGFFDRALAVEPARRFASAAEMRAALPASRLQSQPQPQPLPLPQPQPIATRADGPNWRALLAGAALAIALAVGVMGWMRQRGGNAPAFDPAPVAALIDRGALVAPADPNALDALLRARDRGVDAAALAPLEEKLLARLDAAVQDALAGADLAALEPAWRRWKDAVRALGVHGDLTVIAREGAIEQRLTQELDAALNRFDRTGAAAALAVVDAWDPAPPALVALASRVRTLPVSGAKFSDRDGPELILIRPPAPDRAGIALAAAAVSPAMYEQFRAARGRREAACEQKPVDVQGCVDLAAARELAAWMSERTGERYRLPSREELEPSIGVIAPAPMRAWTSTCNEVRVTMRPNVARRAWSGVRKLFGRSVSGSTVTRCRGYFALPLDGAGEATALSAANVQTTVVLLREIPAPP